jgi:Xaa-Pro aminopeptidase
MKERGYDAYIIPHGDCHDNEYIAESDERIKFISNFSGSNGIGLVTQDVALMWTDGRYFIQIEKELYPGWKMKKMREEESLSEYVLNNLDENITIGMDYSLFTQESAMRIKNKLSRYNIVDDKNNIIDDIWGTIRPKYKNNKLLILSEKFTGQTVFEKYQNINRMLTKVKNAQNYRLLISRLDDIAWFLNLRGSDIPYNPVFFSYALFCKKKDQFCTKLFVNKEKLDTPELKKYCEDNEIILFNYEDIIPELEKSEENLVTFYDEDSTNHRMFQTLKEIKIG